MPHNKKYKNMLFGRLPRLVEAHYGLELQVAAALEDRNSGGVGTLELQVAAALEDRNSGGVGMLSCKLPQHWG